MKTLFKNILVLAVMLGTCTSYANATLEVLPTFNNVKKGNAITVTDASGDIVFRGLIKFDGNIRNLYDFSQLKDGLYIIEINKDFEIEISTIEVKNKIASFIKNESKKIFKPIIRIDEDKVIVTKLALNSPEMEVELYYGNELIYSETVEGSKVLNRLYKLNKTIKGDYSAIVKSDGRVYIKNFRI